MADSDDEPVTEPVPEPGEDAPRSRPAPAEPRPVWIDAVFSGTLALAFGLSLVRTPSTAAIAALVFLLGSVAYAIIRFQWTRRHPRPPMMSPRTTDGLLYLGVVLVAFLMSGVDAGSQEMQIAYAVVAGLLIGGTALFLLRREEKRWLRQ